MKPTAVNLIISLITFTCGVAATSFLKRFTVHPEPQNVRVEQSSTGKEDSSAPPVLCISSATPAGEVVFGGGLRIVSDEVQMKSERLRYKVHVTYPQIVGSEDLHIWKLNQRFKELATDQYQWPLSPSRADLRYYREKWPEVFNSVDLNYEIRSASESFLSIYFVGFSYGIGAAHSVQYSFVVNYDLTLRKELKLSDIFNRRSKYLQFISNYCVNELSTQSEFIFEEALTPKVENFESWNITREGVRFNFDECRVFGCAVGEKAVEIPFTALKPFLDRDSSVRVLTDSRS